MEKEQNTVDKRERTIEEDKNIARVLLIGLIYPAVLGSIIYALMGDIVDFVTVNKNTALLSLPFKDILPKISFYLLIVSFFCCDYVYSSWVKPFRVPFFLLDIFVMVALYIMVIFIKISSAAQPSTVVISLAYACVLFLYFIWDFFEPQRNDYPRYYLEMRIWQVTSFICLLLYILFYRGHSSAILLLISILLIIDIWFWRLLWLKRKLGAY
ncbi:MAG: hypothetical protein GY845_00790 [Planctomycetes bacterium]|nr:hypothetical protein [Planctomycetota bacterium]